MKWRAIPLLFFLGRNNSGDNNNKKNNIANDNKNNSNSINNNKNNNNDNYNKNINTSNKKLILKIIKVIIRRIIIMKWYPIPLLLFEGANTNNEMARHSIIIIIVYLGSK